MRTLSVVLMLALLAACGSESSDPPAKDGAVRTIDRATVTDVPAGDGPILCTGPVRESAPPQCEGPVITNWDWAKVWGAAGEVGAQFGDFCFEGKDVGDTFELTTLPRPVGTCGTQEYLARASVLEDGGTFGQGHGPQLCMGGIRLSMPPQCDGPDIPNWSWDKVTGESRRSQTTYGVYVVHGIYVDGDFTLTRPPLEPQQFEGEVPADALERDFKTPCLEPDGGWFPKDRPKLDEYAVERAAPFAEKLPGYSEVWIDQQFNEGTENDPNKIILNVRVTKDVKGAEKAMRTVWKGALCVSKATHTEAELQRIQQETRDMAKGLVLSTSSGDDHVDVDVILDEGGRLQKAFDDKYGAGVVRVSSALSKAPSGM
ncbi:hypothetical protein J2X11_000864 [Aeromicrobium panaciterrae]|uniref:Uncharacterized protein n=1 Tax=Aeromicrobium panaciterrae TaxID=363861 RepID=A0ABU1ULI9_9ACTN|nr:hypothetical protein [Aeromicrobium panaciterrae]MDR7086025.1 hypothetical protein [Aeromicrobium panaciterrae]